MMQSATTRYPHAVFKANILWPPLGIVTVSLLPNGILFKFPLHSCGDDEAESLRLERKKNRKNMLNIQNFIRTSEEAADFHNF